MATLDVDIHISRIETNIAADLAVGDTPLEDEPADVPRVGVEAVGDLLQGQQFRHGARHATPAEQELFGTDPHGIVLEHSHGTYGADGEALEAVINVRPAHGNVITFDTYEAPIGNE